MSFLSRYFRVKTSVSEISELSQRIQKSAWIRTKCCSCARVLKCYRRVCIVERQVVSAPRFYTSPVSLHLKQYARSQYAQHNMAPNSDFQYRASRLASFTEGTKLGNTKSLKFWTSSSLSPDHLADCGFHYTPTKTYPDQVTCFWCAKKERNLDNVASISELHLQNWPTCPYSTIVSHLEHFVKDSDKEKFWLRLPDAPISVTQPHSTLSILLRLSTFKNFWKFDNKRRSKTKVTSRGLAEAGFYYSPVDQNDDRVICMYCDCPLSDWELQDDPMVEHQKNSFVFCYFLHTMGHEGEKHVEIRENETEKPTEFEAIEAGTETHREKAEARAPALNEEPVSDDPNSSAPSLEAKHTLFDAFDFSIEDLEQTDNATIFHNQDILPKRFTRKRKQELQNEQQRKRMASGMPSTSLALTVREVSDEESPEEVHYTENSLSEIHTTLLSTTHEVLDDDDYTEPSHTKKEKKEKKAGKPKSQFSDDEFDLDPHDVEAILNSPKKSRKMKILKQDTSSLSADIFNNSHQNIGDYDEQNLSYLEEHIHKKLNRLVRGKSTVLTVDPSEEKAEVSAVLSIPASPIEVADSSPQKSPQRSNLSSIELAPQSLPKAGDSIGTDGLESPVEDVEVENPVKDVELETPVENNDLENPVHEVDIGVERLSDGKISSESVKSPETNVPVDTPSASTSFESNKKLDKNFDVSHEFIEEMGSQDLGTSSRASIEAFNLSPSYEEYKKELQDMESQLIETSSPQDGDSIKDMEIQETGRDVDDVERKVRRESVENEVSRIDESVSENFQELSVNTSLLDRKSITPPVLDPVEDQSEEQDSESEKSDDKESGVENYKAEIENDEIENEEIESEESAKTTDVEEKVEKVCEKVIEKEIEDEQLGDNATSASIDAHIPQPSESLTTHGEEPNGNETNGNMNGSMNGNEVNASSPQGFLYKFVERVKSLSPRKKDVDRPSFLDIEASTPEKRGKGELSTVSMEKAVLEIEALEETIEYLVEVAATEHELHNDVEGTLTEFIAAMPEEEEIMSISEWIVHNAKTCRRTIEEITENIIHGYLSEFDKVIAHVEQLETVD